MRFILSFMLLLPVALHGQSVLRLQPERPVGGAPLSLRYRSPSLQSPSSSDSLVAEVLCMGPRPIVIDVALRPERRFFIGSFNVPEDTRALFVRISSGDRIDDRDGDCWRFPIVDKSGTPVPGALAQLSMTSRLGGHLSFSIPVDLDVSSSYAEQERRLHPDASWGWGERWRAILARDQEVSYVRIRAELDSLLASWSDRQQEVCDLLPFLELTGQGARATKLEQTWAERDPGGPMAQRTAWQAASNEPDPRTRLEMIERLMRNFAVTPDDDLLQLLVHTAIAAEQWDKADEYIHRMPRKEPTLMEALVRRLLATKTTVDRATVLAKEAVNAARNYDPALKPAHLSLREYRARRASEVTGALRMYGDALTALGYTSLAEKVYDEASKKH